MPVARADSQCLAETGRSMSFAVSHSWLQCLTWASAVLLVLQALRRRSYLRKPGLTAATPLVSVTWILIQSTGAG